MQKQFARSAPLKIAFVTCRNSASRLGNVMYRFIDSKVSNCIVHLSDLEI